MPLHTRDFLTEIAFGPWRSTMDHGMTIVAEGLAYPEGPVLMPDGSIALVEIRGCAIKRIEPGGRISTIGKVEGGPNGMALGPDGFLYVCNNGGSDWTAGGPRLRAGAAYSSGSIDRVNVKTGETATVYTRCGEYALSHPNDIAFDRHGGFYFTDYGKNFGRHKDHGGLYYALPDGSRICEVTYPVFGANGLGLSPDGDVVYVSETESARLWAFAIIEPGVVLKEARTPHGGRLVFGMTGYHRFDGLALDCLGNICVATLESGQITVISPDGRLLREVPTPDTQTTNICFGGPNLETAYITLTGSGRLAAMTWPERGLPLTAR